MKSEGTPRLVLEWVDPPTRPDAEWWWVQVAQGMHRLVDVRERLEAVSRMRDPQRALVEFRAALELCWWHTYAVRDRAIELLAVKTTDRKAAGAMKSPTKRCAAQAVLSAKDPSLTSKVAALVQLIDATVAHRNQHTHNIYVGIALDVGYDSYSPDDVLDEIGSGRNSREIRRSVAAVVRRKSRDCAAHLQQVIDCLSDLVMHTHVTARGLNGLNAGRIQITQVAFP